MKKVCVLMSTYNGEKYLSEQIDSVLNQEGVEVSLYVRDDGSKDGTRDILKKYASKDNVYLVDDSSNLGPRKSFLRLVEVCGDYDYYAFCDQDDIWDKDKLLVACNKLSSLPKGPSLYYSNLRVVDENNNYCRLSHTSPHVAKSRLSCLSESLPTGCTMVFNAGLFALIKKAGQVEVTMHDSWTYLVAGLFGNVIYDFEPHISYRQHGGNVIGASKKILSFASLKRELSLIFDWKSQPRFTNAKAFYNSFKDDIKDELIKKEVEKVVFYKKNPIRTLKLLFDRKINSGNLRRRLRFKIKVVLHNI